MGPERRRDGLALGSGAGVGSARRLGGRGAHGMRGLAKGLGDVRRRQSWKNKPRAE